MHNEAQNVAVEKTYHDTYEWSQIISCLLTLLPNRNQFPFVMTQTLGYPCIYMIYLYDYGGWVHTLGHSRLPWTVPGNVILADNSDKIDGWDVGVAGRE